MKVEQGSRPRTFSSHPAQNFAGTLSNTEAFELDVWSFCVWKLRADYLKATTRYPDGSKVPPLPLRTIQEHGGDTKRESSRAYWTRRPSQTNGYVV